MFTGIAVERPKSLDLHDRTGKEDIGPEDTFDGDYGRLLDRAYEKSVKVLASPPGFEPDGGVLLLNAILEGEVLRRTA